MLKNTQTGDSIWTVGVGVVGFTDPLMFIILDEADAPGDLVWGDEAEWCEEVMVVTATTGEACAEVTASHLDLNASKDAFSYLRASERRGIEAFGGLTLTVYRVKSEPHSYRVHNCFVI